MSSSVPVAVPTTNAYSSEYESCPPAMVVGITAEIGIVVEAIIGMDVVDESCWSRNPLAWALPEGMYKLLTETA